MCKNLTKMHHRIMHTLPFVPSRKRQKGFEIIRHFANWSLHMRAHETLNHYDLITLLFLAKRYLAQDYEDLGYRLDDGRRVVRLKIDLELLVKERGLDNHRNNRHSVVLSLERLMSCQFTVIEVDGSRTAAWIISGMRIDGDEKKVDVDCNARFLEWCGKGILVNLGRLCAYKDNGVAVLIDAFLQGTKQKKGGRWMYREWVSEDVLFNIIDPHKTQARQRLRGYIKNAFALMAAHGLPHYFYNKTRRRWERPLRSRAEV